MAGTDPTESDDLDEIPVPATPEARSQGCTCPDPEPGQGTPENPRRVNMECHVHGLLWLLKEAKGRAS